MKLEALQRRLASLKEGIKQLKQENTTLGKAQSGLEHKIQVPKMKNKEVETDVNTSSGSSTTLVRAFSEPGEDPVSQFYSDKNFYDISRSSNEIFDQSIPPFTLQVHSIKKS